MCLNRLFYFLPLLLVLPVYSFGQTVPVAPNMLLDIGGLGSDVISTDMKFDAQGNIYVADLQNYAIRKITTAGVVTTVVGGLKLSALISNPGALTFDTKGNLFISDQNGRILELTANKVLLTVAGKTATAGFADGQGASALFNAPQGLVADANGNIWIADSNNNRIRKLVPPSGI